MRTHGLDKPSPVRVKLDCNHPLHVDEVRELQYECLGQFSCSPFRKVNPDLTEVEIDKFLGEEGKK